MCGLGDVTGAACANEAAVIKLREIPFVLLVQGAGRRKAPREPALLPRVDLKKEAEEVATIQCCEAGS